MEIFCGARLEIFCFSGNLWFWTGLLGEIFSREKVIRELLSGSGFLEAFGFDEDVDMAPNTLGVFIVTNTLR